MECSRTEQEKKKNIAQVHFSSSFYEISIELEQLKTAFAGKENDYHFRLAAVIRRLNFGLCAIFKSTHFSFYYLITFIRGWKGESRGESKCRVSCVCVWMWVNVSEWVSNYVNLQIKKLNGNKRLFMLHVVRRMSVNVIEYHAINLYHNSLKIAQYIHVWVGCLVCCCCVFHFEFFFFSYFYTPKDAYNKKRNTWYFQFINDKCETDMNTAQVPLAL